METNGESKSDVAYPLYDLAESLKICEAVRDLGGGNSPVVRSLLAQHLKYAETGPSFVQRVSSARAFGLIDGKGAYQLTDIAKQYFYPTRENGREDAAVKALTTPKSFAILVQKFDGGKLPAADMLGNIIHMEAGIAVSKKSMLAGLFLRSVQFIGAVDSGGFLRCKAIVAASARSAQVNTPPPPETPAPTPAINPPPPSRKLTELEDHEDYLMFLDKDKKRRFAINSPLHISRAEYVRICKWIEFTLIVDDEEKTE